MNYVKSRRWGLQRCRCVRLSFGRGGLRGRMEKFCARNGRKQLDGAYGPLYVGAYGDRRIAIIRDAAATESRAHPNAARALVYVSQHGVGRIAAAPHFQRAVFKRARRKANCEIA